MIPYGRQSLDAEDIKAVEEVLNSDWLTCGPKIPEFEQSVATFCNASHGVAFTSGTAALHAAMFALQIGSGDEVIVSPMTFAATANCILYVGGTPVFSDVVPGTLLLDPCEVESKITERTRAIIAVDYAGQPCDWQALKVIAQKHGLALVADSCHALGASIGSEKVGTLADLSVFSFHPVKHIATGEGGMVLCSDQALADRMRLFRNHGISTDTRQREASGDWFYEMVDLGYNYRMTDIQAALGVSQMKRLPAFLERRREIAHSYDEAFAGSAIRPLDLRQGIEHAYHLYVVRLSNRDEVFKGLRQRGIGVQVHYVPVHLHPYYQKNLGTREGLCPVAEKAYSEVLSLPMFAALTDEQFKIVISVVSSVIDECC